MAAARTQIVDNGRLLHSIRYLGVVSLCLKEIRIQGLASAFPTARVLIAALR
jgi:hypothetical protein